MDKKIIIAEFYRLKNIREEKNYLIVSGLGGVGKTALIEELQNILEGDHFPFFSINSDYEISNYEIFVYIAKQLIYLGYNGKYNTELDVIISKLQQGKDSNIPNRDDFRKLPLFDCDNNVNLQNNESLNIDVYKIISSALKEFYLEHECVFFMDLSVRFHSIEEVIVRLLTDVIPSGLIVIASRQPHLLFEQCTSDNIHIYQLSPLNMDEIRVFLYQNFNIKNTKIVKDLVGFSGGYIKFLFEGATYLQKRINENNSIYSKTFRSYIAKLIIDCHLRELSDPIIINFVKQAGLCRTLSWEAIRLVMTDGNIQKMYETLLQCSFVINKNEDPMLISCLRNAINDEWRIQSPDYFTQVNNKLIKYYRKIVDTYSEENKQEKIIDILYYNLCVDETHGVSLVNEMLSEAEEGFDLYKYETILKGLENYPFRINTSNEWETYWYATNNRLNCRWEDAEIFYTELIKEASSITVKGYCNYSLGILYRYKGNWDTAEIYFQNAINIFRGSHNDYLRFISMVLKGNILARKHLWAESLDILLSALELAEKNSSNTPQLFLAYLNLGKLSRSQGNYPSAKSRLLKALEISLGLRNSNYEAITYLELGKLSRAMCDWEQSLIYLNDCLRIRKNLKDKLGQAMCLHSLGTTLLRQGELNRARSSFIDSLDIKYLIFDIYGQAKTLYSLGHIERREGDYWEALKHYKKALKLFEKSGNQQRISQTLCRIGMTYASKRIWGTAFNYLEKSRLIRVRAKDQQGISESLFELGVIQDQQGETEDALESFRLSATQARESSSIGREIPAIVALVRTYILLDLRASAVQAALEARTLARNFSRYQLLSKEYLGWGNKDFAHSKYQSAIFCFAEAIDVILCIDLRTVSEYISQMIVHLEKVAKIINLHTANRFSGQIIEHWKNLSDVNTRKYYLQVLQEINHDPNDYNLETLIKICKIISRDSIEHIN